jgi:hypothetical protein
LRGRERESKNREEVREARRNQKRGKKASAQDSEILPFNYPLILTGKHFKLTSAHPLKNKVQSLNSRHLYPPYPGLTCHIRYTYENKYKILFPYII